MFISDIPCEILSVAVLPIKANGIASTEIVQGLMYNPGEGSGYGSMYDDYSSIFGWYNPSGGYDGLGSNFWSDFPCSFSGSSSADTYINSSIYNPGDDNILVTFNGRTSDNKTGDQLVTANLVNTLSSILISAAVVDSINITATTNGHAYQNASTDHNSGRAVDINIVNGVHVSASGQGLELAKKLEQAAMSDPQVRYVEGPFGNFARNSPTGNWVRTPDLPSMNNHVHISVFKN